MRKIVLLSVVVVGTTGVFSQNVGVGTSSPADKLHVFGGNATIEGTTYPWLSFRNGGVLKGFIGVNNNDMRIGAWPGTNNTGHITFTTGNTDRIRIMSDGDVGIGSLTPQSRLHISNPSGATQLTIGSNYTSGGFTALYMGTSALVNGYGYLQGVRASGGAFGDVVLNPNGGNVGIRSTATRGIFDIGGNDEPIYLASSTMVGNQRIAYMPGNIFMAPWAGDNVAYLDARRSGPSSSALSLQIRTTHAGGILTNTLYLGGGLIGVAHSDPKTTLDVDGDFLLRNTPVNRGIMLDADNSFSGTSGTGLVFKSTILPSGLASPISGIAPDGSYSQASDSSLKKNVHTIGAVLSSVLQLRPVRYHFKTSADDAPVHTGFIAQEVERLFPDLVTGITNSNGVTIKMVNYDGFAVLAIKAIQEQENRIEKIERELGSLKELLQTQIKNK